MPCPPSHITRCSHSHRLRRQPRPAPPPKQKKAEPQFELSIASHAHRIPVACPPLSRTHTAPCRVYCAVPAQPQHAAATSRGASHARRRRRRRRRRPNMGEGDDAMQAQDPYMTHSHLDADDGGSASGSSRSGSPVLRGEPRRRDVAAKRPSACECPPGPGVVPTSDSEVEDAAQNTPLSWHLPGHAASPAFAPTIPSHVQTRALAPAPAGCHC